MGRRFRKRPVVIEAWNWLFSDAQEEPPDWVTDALNRYPDVGGVAFWPDGVQGQDPDDSHIAIVTLEGEIRAVPGDWIIQGVKGELYPCKPDIFAQTYEEVTE